MCRMGVVIVVAWVVVVGAKILSPLPMVNHQGIEFHVGGWSLP